MKLIVTAAALLGLASAAQAQESQVILMGDTAMTCREIIVAANEQSEILGGVPEAGLFASEAAVNTMTSLAVEGALRSGAARAVPGIGAVGGLFGRAAREREEREAERRGIAERRWYYLNGLYQGRDCEMALRREAELAAAAAVAPVQTAPLQSAVTETAPASEAVQPAPVEQAMPDTTSDSAPVEPSDNE